MRPPVNFCQVCGQPMTERQIHGRLRPICPACGFVHFADPKVAAVVFVENDGKVLLVKRAFNPERGKWALPAGYIDDGEDPREAAVREVREETGLIVAITDLIGVEGGPVDFGASIIISFAARVLAGEAHATDDAADILWLAPSDPLPELAFESTRRMLAAWLEKHRRSHQR